MQKYARFFMTVSKQLLTLTIDFMGEKNCKIKGENWQKAVFFAVFLLTENAKISIIILYKKIYVSI